MAASSIPAAIDYLVTQVTALPACADVTVSDGWPSSRDNTAVVIGITPDDGSTENDTMHAEIGAQTQWEQYAIPCMVWSYIGGTDMKAARDAAFAVFDAIDSLLRTTAGRTLGGALHSGTAIVADVQVIQTGTAAEAGEGRMCEIRFNVRCKSRSAA